MAYPTKPSIQTSYTAVEQSLGDGSLPGQELDVDFAGLKFAVDALNDFVRGITRSDGRLANASVSRETLGPDILIGFDAPTTWTEARAYAPPQTVFFEDAFYICVIEHTSGSDFAADLAANRWELLVDFGAVLDGALAAEDGAQATLAEFRTRYLGAAAADPALDPAGGALIDGALYWNTGARRLKVYDLATAAWYFVSPTAAEQTNINTVAGISADVTSVAGVSASVPTVAAIDTNVTTVAGISANVTTVAGIAPNVTTVAGVSADVTTVAGIAPNVMTVADVSADVTAVAAIDTDVTAVAGIAPDVTTVAGISADVTTVATNIADVTNFADVYLGPAASDPAVRSDGSALQAGDLYFNTVSDDFRVYDGAAWRSVVFGAVPQTSDTGAAEIPVGTQAQRPTPVIGQFRFNSDTGQFEGYNGTLWGAVGGGATGGGNDDVFVQNGQTVTTNYTIPADKNAMSTGPITVNAGATVTVSAGARYVVI